jgi:hypothetical protein
VPRFVSLLISLLFLLGLFSVSSVRTPAAARTDTVPQNPNSAASSHDRHHHQRHSTKRRHHRHHKATSGGESTPHV